MALVCVRARVCLFAFCSARSLHYVVYIVLIRFCRPLLLDESGVVFQHGAVEFCVRKSDEHSSDSAREFSRYPYTLELHSTSSYLIIVLFKAYHQSESSGRQNLINTIYTT